MKTIKHIFGLLILTVIMASFSQCSSAQKLQKKAPITINQVYYQKWIAGVEGGGSGVNIFIETSSNTIKLDSVYFQGKGAKLVLKPSNDTLYIGRFISDFNKKEDMVFSSDPNKEYGNKPPQLPVKIPFELNDDECVISYSENDKTKYFKLKNIKERESINYPMMSSPENN
ncbi:MAG: hypothetical protein R2816_01525 [Flavobacteriaceae bacterium]|nr:hypothetical protein [Flavobacteriaceae bacterium]